jgi:crossover junction endodeoxyribonuclease RuvC
MPDPRIAALDLSLSSTGLARYDIGEGGITTHRIRGRGDGMPRLHGLREETCGLVGPVDLALIEAPAFSRNGQGTRAAAEWAGVLKLALYEAGIPVLLVHDGHIKKYATGKGNAEKDAMLIEALRRMPNQLITGNDEADALWLLQMALAHYGLPHVQMPKANRVVLDKIAWPALAPTEVSA